MKLSLTRIELPGFSVSGGKYCSTVLATAGIEPRWPGLKLPCAIMMASLSKIAVEKSSPSRTPSEKAVLPQRHAELVGDGDQRVPHHRQRDRDRRCARHGRVAPAMSMMMLPAGLIRATSPGRMTVGAVGVLDDGRARRSCRAPPASVGIEHGGFDVAAGFRKPGPACAGRGEATRSRLAAARASAHCAKQRWRRASSPPPRWCPRHRGSDACACRPACRPRIARSA